MQWNFDYGYARVNDFHVITKKDAKTGKSGIEAIELDGQRLVPSQLMELGFR